MKAGTTVCGLPGCFAPFPDGNTIACPFCLETPTGDIHGTKHDFRYCSHAHLQYDTAHYAGLCGERSNLRMRSRAAELFRMVYNCTMMNLWPAQFEIQGHTTAPEAHLVTIGSRTGPWDGSP
jgi:hypothetical protein